MKTALKLLAVAAVFLAPRPSAAQSVAMPETSAGPIAIQESDGELSSEVRLIVARGDEMTRRLRFDAAAHEYRRAADVARRENHLASGTTWKAATAYFTDGNMVAAAGLLDQLADDAALVGDLQVEALSIYYSAWLNAKAGRKLETASRTARLEGLLRSQYMPVAVREQLSSWLASAKTVASVGETN
ncbi:MAG TPA: hypothetical protein VH436_31090 [Vicinamibacterales bacterium]|jgi:hypothetical protein